MLNYAKPRMFWHFVYSPLLHIPINVDKCKRAKAQGKTDATENGNILTQLTKKVAKYSSGNVIPNGLKYPKRR